MTYPISEIDGLSAFTASKLKSLGIRTTEALLEAASTVKGRKALAAKTGISEQQLLEWANFSDYMRIPGMGKAKVGLVRAAGVTTVRELALRNPSRLAQNMKEVNIKRKLVRVLPSEKSVEQLIAQRPQAAAQDHLLDTLAMARPARLPSRPHLDSHARTAQSDRMIATTSRPAAMAIPAGHPVLNALVLRAISGGDGRLECYAGFIFRWRTVYRARARSGAGPAHGRRRRRLSSTSARNPPGPMARNRSRPMKS